jgi:hypothetical protein
MACRGGCFDPGELENYRDAAPFGGHTADLDLAEIVQQQPHFAATRLKIRVARACSS